MSNTPKEQTAEYNPINCDHRKENGLSGYTLLSHSSGSGPNFQHQKHLSICLLCGNIRISGHDLKDGQIHKYNEEISIDLPDAVAAIVKNCNYMNRETEGYIPFVQAHPHLNQAPTEDKQSGETVSLEEIKQLKAQLHRKEQHMQLMKNTWMSVCVNHTKWIEAIKEYFDSEHTEAIQSFDDFKDQFDLED